MKVSFCVTNRNRLEHAKKTIPRNLEMLRSFENTEMTLLNYGSEEDLDGWVREELKDWIVSGKLIYGVTKHPKAFRIAHAKNCAHMMATGDVVVNLDSDNWLSQRFIELVLDSFNRHDNPVVKGWGRGYGGRLGVRKDIFQFVGGYDERMDTWGYEDLDLFDRINLASYRFRRTGEVPEITQVKFEGIDEMIDHPRDMRQWSFPNLAWTPDLWDRNEKFHRENLTKNIWNANATNRIDWGRLPDLKLGLP